MTRVLVLDKHAVYRTGLRVLISTQMPRAEVLEVESPVQALAEIQECVFDLVLLDLDLSDSVTVNTLKALHEASPATRFAIISASDRRADILAALARGVHGFISKNQSDADILDAINRLLSGQIYVPRSLTEAGDGEASVNPSGKEGGPFLSTEADLSKLTKRQSDFYCWGRACPTRRSPVAWKLLKRRRKFTWLRYCARSACATVLRPPIKQVKSPIWLARLMPRVAKRMIRGCLTPSIRRVIRTHLKRL